MRPNPGGPAPRDPTPAALAEPGPVFLSYALGFVYVGTYRNNHHHPLHLAECVGGGVTR